MLGRTFHYLAALYWVKDNATFAGISVNRINVDGRTEILKAAKEKYNSYNTSDWIRAGFDEFSGGYRVYHKKHQFDPTIGKFGIPRGDYEKIASKVLAKYGMSVELWSEAPGEDKIPDGLLNGVRFDIKGVEGIGDRIIKSKISEASKQGAETVVLYYHDRNFFSKEQVKDGYHFYLRNSKSKRISRLYYIVDNKLHIVK